MRRVVLIVALGLTVLLPNVVFADEMEKEEEAPALKLSPSEVWALFGDLTGKYVARSGSKSQYLADYNLQSGVDGAFSAGRELPDDQTVQMEGLGSSGEGQGYFIGQYNRLQRYSLLVDVAASRLYFNTRNGETRPSDVSFFPFTNNSNVFFNDEEPSIQRISSGFLADYRPESFFHDVYLDFHYRSVDGVETLLNNGTVADPTASAPGSGPGTVAFEFPSRQNVDYTTFTTFLGGRSGAGDVNWQSDATYEHSTIRSSVVQANFGTSSISEADRFLQDNDVDVLHYDLAGSRFLSPDLYVYGGYLFSFEHNGPKPSQEVSVDSGAPVTTRDTQGGNVQRVANSLGFGVLFQPHSTVVMTANTQASGSVQSGEITEMRDESQLLTGDVGTIRNNSDRNWVNSNTQVAADWTPMARTLFHAFARYRYRQLANDINRNYDLVQVTVPEIENYTDHFNRFELGTSGRWNLGSGRAVEIGYRYLDERIGVSVDQLSNGFIQNDSARWQNKPYLKASARLLKNLRGELRFEYVQEHRRLDAPLVDPVIFPSATTGKTTWNAFSVVPTLTYQPDPQWNLYGSVAVSQAKLGVDNLGTLPNNFGNFQGFQYSALTETLSVGAAYAPTQQWSFSTAYTFVNSSESVQNQINRVELTARYKLNKQWNFHAGYRYLRFDQAETAGVNNYAANVPFIGVSGYF